MITCLVGFDFDGFDAVQSLGDTAESEFQSRMLARLEGLADEISAALSDAGLTNELIEVFLFPVPSVQMFRDRFQKKIGWKD
ncbi:MAG: hypothetical protein KC800_32910 [Candidatus Eremiobacteraeota bacterium]|nr:hypothetical protein [Candidatus Eremiobacteraeota bacterium]